MAVGTLVFERSSYENVVCLGHILAEDGRKMSKHLGNILEPMPLMERHGADALRWFMAAGGSPWLPRRVGHATLQEIVRKVLLTYWNTVSFQSLYGRTAGFVPGRTPVRPLEERPALDRWALSRRTASPWRSTRRWPPSTPSGPERCWPATSTTCRTGTSAGRVDGSGRAIRMPSRRCTSACTS
jgi:isoleucyl-tRNA synthetase